MSKEVKDVVDNVAGSEVDEVQAQEQANQISIQIADIIDALQIIEVAIERSAFKAPELVSVMPVYQKLKAFAEEVQKAEKKGE